MLKEHKCLLNIKFASPSESITKAIDIRGLSREPGTLGSIAEMLKPAWVAGVAKVCDLTEAIISEGSIPTFWQESYIYKLEQRG